MQPHLKGHVHFRIHYWWWVWLACLTFRSINFLELYQGQNRDLNIMQSSRMELPWMSAGRECVWTAQRPLHIDFSTSVMHWFLSRAYSDNEALPSSGHGLHSNACLSFTVWRHFISVDARKPFTHIVYISENNIKKMSLSSVTACHLVENLQIHTTEHSDPAKA